MTGPARWLRGPPAGAVTVAAVTGVVTRLPALGLLPLYLLAVLPVAVRWGAGPAAAVAVVSTVLFGHLFPPSARRWWFAEVDNAAATGVFLVTAVVVGELAASRSPPRSSRPPSRTRRAPGWIDPDQQPGRRGHHARRLAPPVSPAPPGRRVPS
ncbi:hypothetical protein Psuf_081980 [Phytohabitans suffuscus]|uniref:Sensor protein KdpD transmembrane domain-containing protein n=1 Tax=Phytohabitans suffuscus TaxID=624315 RepID=A0A6F8YXI9_9ACTN|nr:hypothetical protein Psuf_081980 [Phytohabitans suffuscus]